MCADVEVAPAFHLLPGCRVGYLRPMAFICAESIPPFGGSFANSTSCGPVAHLGIPITKRRCAEIMGPLEIVFAVIGVLLVGILCFFGGTYYRKRVGEREIALRSRRPPGLSTKPSAAVRAGKRKCFWKPRTKFIDPVRSTKRKSKSAVPS